MSIQWKDELSVGVKEIDDDHKELIAIANELLAACAKGAPDPTVLKASADKLMAYAQRHFEREELIQLKAKYPLYDDHKAAHNTLIDTLEAFIQRYFVDKREPIDDLTATEVRGFLRTWLIDHILKTDMKMKGKLTPA